MRKLIGITTAVLAAAVPAARDGQCRSRPVLGHLDRLTDVFVHG